MSSSESPDAMGNDKADMRGSNGLAGQRNLTTNDADGQATTVGSADAPKPKRIACVICRKRKLRCDSQRPKCSNCARLGHDCSYDSYRRKSGPRRGYVKELEKRLAQVESQLHTQEESPNEMNEPSPIFQTDMDIAAGTGAFPMSSLEPRFGQQLNGQETPELPLNPIPMSDQQQQQISSLGVNEPLPPPQTQEELTNIYFEKMHPSMPMIHRRRFQAAMQFPSFAQPPVCIRYAMWCLAASVTDKYLAVQYTFYQRARKYLEADEMEACGQMMITIAHAQCWSMIATYEFKLMYFPRAWMSVGRAVRVCQMMGLHRIDGHGLDVKQCLAPPKDWTEKEERRRTFWIAFCSDRYASICTGWPMIVEEKDIQTNLPSTEEAYENSKPQKTQPLKQALSPSGASNLSPFAAVVLMASLFGRNLTHLHRPEPNDCDDDLNGEFWKRHRRLDNILANTALSLPDHLRLAAGIREPNIVFTNMNIQTSTICLHQAAIFKAEKNNMDRRIIMESKDRCVAAAMEITSFLKRTAFQDLSAANPFLCFCLYVAARVFIQAVKASKPDESIKSMLRFLLDAMQTLKKKNPLTESFLVQLSIDLEGSGIDLPSNNSQYAYNLKTGVDELFHDGPSARSTADCGNPGIDFSETQQPPPPPSDNKTSPNPTSQLDSGEGSILSGLEQYSSWRAQTDALHVTLPERPRSEQPPPHRYQENMQPTTYPSKTGMYDWRAGPPEPTVRRSPYMTELDPSSTDGSDIMNPQGGRGGGLGGTQSNGAPRSASQQPSPTTTNTSTSAQNYTPKSANYTSSSPGDNNNSTMNQAFAQTMAGNGGTFPAPTTADFTQASAASQAPAEPFDPQSLSLPVWHGFDSTMPGLDASNVYSESLGAPWDLGLEEIGVVPDMDMHNFN